MKKFRTIPKLYWLIVKNILLRWKIKALQKSLLKRDSFWGRDIYDKEMKSILQWHRNFMLGKNPDTRHIIDREVKSKVDEYENIIDDMRKRWEWVDEQNDELKGVIEKTQNELNDFKHRYTNLLASIKLLESKHGIKISPEKF